MTTRTVKTNSGAFVIAKTILGVAILTALAGCESSIGDLSSYDYKTACAVVPDIESTLPQPVFTNGPINDAASLSAGIAFDYSERLSGAMPGPSAGTGLVFSNIVVTDKTVQSLFVRGDVPAGKRIGALFVQIDGTSEYFAIPIEPGGATGATTGTPILVTLRGPFPLEGTEPEPDIITTEVLADITVRAFLVDEAAEAPDVTIVIDGSDDDNNWLLPDTALTIKAVNAGTGGLTATLFWNTATDIDLRMFEPDGNEIYYLIDLEAGINRRKSVAGDGFLDLDDTSGFGPENIFFETDIPFGRYRVNVNYYAGAGEPPTNWSVSITACGSTRAFTGLLTSIGETQEVLAFDYGENCSIEPVVAPPTTPGVFEQAVLCDPDSLQTLVPVEED
jgi:hypothetical protein